MLEAQTSMKLLMHMNKLKQRIYLSLEQVVTVSLGVREAMCCSRRVETVWGSAFQSEFCIWRSSVSNYSKYQIMFILHDVISSYLTATFLFLYRYK